MPAQTQKAAVGFGAGLKQHAKDETTYGQDFSRLPPGIQNGVAQLFEAKRGVYKTGKNQGKPFLHLRGTVIEPETVTYTPKFWGPSENGTPAGIRMLPPVTVKVAGLQTSLTLPMRGTTKKDKDGNVVEVSAADNAAIICNELRKLGGDDCLDSLSSLPANVTDAQAEAALDPILEALKGAGIRFKIGTRAGNPSAQYPEPMVFEEWYGTQGLASAEPGAEPPADAVDASEQQPTDEVPADSAPAEGGEIDIDGLLAAANNGDKDAQTALLEAAVQMGHSKDDAEAAADWEAVVELINNPPSEEVAEEEWKPAAKETYGFKPLVKNKSGKLVPGTKQIDCTVVSVDEAKQTCVLLSSIDKKTKYSSVKWDALVRE